MLRRRDRIISKVKANYCSTLYKFGIRVLKTVTEAYEIDMTTGTDYWTKSIEKEIMNVRVALEKLDGVAEEKMRTGKIKSGYKFCRTHMIFDILMDGKLTCKARLVEYGHETDAPTLITYLSLVSRDSVRIGLTIT